jgi:pimeloyl-ACP methyl ester carboxylesterase
VTHTGPAIWAEEAGDAAHPLVVLVHGAMDRSAGMLRLSRRLDHEYRVVRYDRRGYGRSTPHGGPVRHGRPGGRSGAGAGRPAEQ